MKTLLFSLSLLLTHNCYPIFDTLEAKALINKVTQEPYGNRIWSSIALPEFTGAVVLKVKDFPFIERNKIHFDTTEQLYLMKMEYENIATNLHNTQDFGLLSVRKRIDSLKDQIHRNRLDESRLLTLKRSYDQNELDASQVIRFSQYFQDEISKLRKQQQIAYKTMKQLQKELNESRSLINEEDEKLKTVYLTLYLDNKMAGSFNYNYFQAYPYQTSNASTNFMDSNTNRIYTYKGLVLDGEDHDPLPYAQIILIQNQTIKEYLYSDADGKFEVDLKPHKYYKMIVKLKGYKREKLKHYMINPKANYNQIAVQMDPKSPLTPMEILSYSLPLLDLIFLVSRQ